MLILNVVRSGGGGGSGHVLTLAVAGSQDFSFFFVVPVHILLSLLLLLLQSVARYLLDPKVVVCVNSSLAGGFSEVESYCVMFEELPASTVLF
jgi:hypothetical protein